MGVKSPRGYKTIQNHQQADTIPRRIRNWRMGVLRRPRRPIRTRPRSLRRRRSRARRTERRRQVHAAEADNGNAVAQPRNGQRTRTRRFAHDGARTGALGRRSPADAGVAARRLRPRRRAHGAQPASRLAVLGERGRRRHSPRRHAADRRRRVRRPPRRPAFRRRAPARSRRHGPSPATPILLLDEPTANLDLAYQPAIMRLLRDVAGQGRAVIVAVHDLTLAAQFCDEIALLSNGRRIAAGAPWDVLTEDLIRQVYDARRPCA